MHTLIPNTAGPAYYTVSEAAWLLDVTPARVSRAIRVGTLRAGWRRSRLVVPASELVRLLPDLAGTSSNGARQAGDAR